MPNRAAKNLYGVILAGGSGERFWPLSRTKRPKQCLAILGNGTMVQQACRRLQAVLPPANILVITRQGIEKLIAEQLPQLPKRNIVAEPCGRDTAAAVALAACIVQDRCKRESDAAMIVIPADHIVQDTVRLGKTFLEAAQVARAQDVLVTFGVPPTYPATGYGYIQVGDIHKHSGKQRFFGVRSYREKPNLATARSFLQSGDYWWNGGMFVWRAQTILREIGMYLPGHARMCDALCKAGTASAFARVLKDKYPGLPKISIDFGVLEKSRKVVVAQADLGWDDLGSWTSLAKYLEANADGNTILGHGVVLGGRGNLVRSGAGHLIGIVGVNDLLVIHTEDATLVCPKGKDQELKALLATIRQDPKKKKFT